MSLEHLQVMNSHQDQMRKNQALQPQMMKMIKVQDQHLLILQSKGLV